MGKILYLGLDLPSELHGKEVTHCPLIRIVPCPREHPDIAQAFTKLHDYTHLIFTSKSAVRIFFDYAAIYGIALETLNQKIYLSVGQKTAQLLKNSGVKRVLTASEETAEGMVTLLASLDLDNSFVFWPHSALSRPLLLDWLQDLSIRVSNFKYHACIFYDTVLNIPEHMPDILSYDEIIFTSLSTVDAFYTLFGKPALDKKLICIGAITQKHLNKIFDKNTL